MRQRFFPASIATPLMIACLMATISATPIQAGGIALLVIDGDSYPAQQAIAAADLPAGIRVHLFTHEALLADRQAESVIRSADVVLVDVMMSELSRYLIDHDLVGDRPVFALRGSRDDEALRRAGFRFDPEIQKYFHYLSVANLVNLIRRIAHVGLDPTIEYGEAMVLPTLGIHHPRAPVAFESYPSYLNWYRQRPGFDPAAPRLGLIFYAAALVPGQVEAIDHLIDRLETSGFSVTACFGKDSEVLNKLLRSEDGAPRVDLVLAFSLKFYSAINAELKSGVAALGVPVINAINLYSQTNDQWRDSPVGISPFDLVWTVANPELSGAVEPTPVSGKIETADPATGQRLYVHQSIDETIQRLIPRLKQWVRLQRKPNADKRVAILFYNHAQGKQNIGASYLNVFRSLQHILERLRREGYRVPEDIPLDEGSLRDLILATARNIGSWAPGELQRMIELGQVVRVPFHEYRSWFDALPEAFKAAVIEQWGEVDSAGIMADRGDLIIPALVLGNVVLLPEPARGWSDDPVKLYHDTRLYPHHQYIAAYLWLDRRFQADAMIHLGTHATYEWLPGKQAGLAPACAPEVMLTDIPNIYPYIVDDVGEGIQAKRRGRAVVIDHLTPALKEAGLYHEYLELREQISNYVKAASMDADTTRVHLKQIEELARNTGLLKDLGLTEVDRDAVERIDLYLHQLDTNPTPYGLHTFGQSPEAAALEDTCSCIVRANPSVSVAEVRGGLAASGREELEQLVKALNGRYVPPGEGNDPVRNPQALPTGRNFHGFSPAKIPSPAAWELGREAAREIIETKWAEQGHYPEKVAVVLWATETLRNEGVHESTILALMGLEPLWDAGGRVTGTRVIAGAELQRPRIDVLINPSGLYRDLFPEKLLFLDQAVRKAAAQTDIENLLRKHNRQVEERLRQAGHDAESAKALAAVRIFSEAPGSYGNGVSEMVAASGYWDSDQAVAEVFKNRSGFAFGEGGWGTPAKELLAAQLAQVDTAIHSISSNIYGTMDNDDMYGSLGGLALAVQKERGQAPEILITRQLSGNQLEVEQLSKTLGRELRSRYLNPRWITGMKQEQYAGAREMSKFVEYLWGWQVSAADAVATESWEQTYQVYVEDKYRLDLKEFFNQASPWAYQSLTARMLEAVRKGYWQADDAVRTRLAVEYAVNVAEKGVACCDHTCNNPLLNQMVVSIVSLPGVLAPELVERFQLAVEQATLQKLTDQASERVRLLRDLAGGLSRSAERSSEQPPPDAEERQAVAEPVSGNRPQLVEGFKMEEMQPRDQKTELSSSGVQWFASVFVLILIGLFITGTRIGAKR